jgi:hypothetical protein
MTQRAPSQLASPRNIALQKGTIPAGFAEPNLIGVVLPIAHDEAVNTAKPVGPAPKGPSPFVVRGA